MITGCFAITNFHPLGVISDFLTTDTRRHTQIGFFLPIKGETFQRIFQETDIGGSSAYLRSGKRSQGTASALLSGT